MKSVREVIPEQTGENFNTNYGKFGRAGGSLSGATGVMGKRPEVENYVIDDQAKCICFCAQRIGSRNEKCPHSFSEDVDEISEIISYQAKEFLMADQHTGQDLNYIKEGLNKVEFIRTKNYLSKLAILISRQEKEIFSLTKKTRSLDQMKDENFSLKSQVDDLNQKLNKTLNLDLANHVEDKNFLSQLMVQKDQECLKLMDQLRDLNQKNQRLIMQVKSQEVEVRTLLTCVETLR